MDLGNTTTLGLDLGSTGFRAVELAWQGNRPTVARWAAAEFPEEVEDWNKTDVPALSGLIARTLKERGVRARLAAHAVCGKSIVPQYFNFPQLMDEDVAEAVRIEVESGLPFRVEDTLFSYILFPDQRTVPGKARTHGLAIAADGNFVEKRLDVIRHAALEPFCVETDATACANAFIISGRRLQPESAAAILNIGHLYTNLALLGSDGTILMRDVPWAGKQITQRIADALRLPLDTAARLKHAHWERGPSEVRDLEEQMPSILQTSVRELVDRLRDTIHYWVSERLVPSLGFVYLTGGGSQVRGLPEMLTDVLSVPVERWAPAEGLAVPRASDGRDERWDYRLSVAFGLALRKFERSVP